LGWPELAARPLPWGNLEVNQGDPRSAVILTRLLAFRNFAGLPFPASATPNQWAAAAARALAWAARSGFPDSVPLSACPPRVVRCLREREILPWQAVPSPGKAGFKHLAAAPDGSAWVLINEVEHLTLGRVYAGCPAPADAAFPDPGTDFGESNDGAGWARSPRYGFLASDPGRAGPGVAIEQVMHLPGLALARELPAARNYCAAAGLAFAPAMSLPASAVSPADFGMFRISSRGRLGMSPGECYAGYLEAIAPVLRRETEMRKACLARHPERLAARVRGALERLAGATSLSFPELLATSSFARLGAAIGLARPEIGKILESLRVTAASGHLGVSSERELTQEEEDFSRANVVRLSLGNQHGEGI
jgi:protein-arginine kinase